MFIIILLIFFGLLFLVAELILLPGVTVALFLALISFGSAIYLAFLESPLVGGIVVGVSVVLSLVTTIVCLRSKTWQRFSLRQKITSSSDPEPARQHVKAGQCGETVSRLAPMGKVDIDGKIYEAKSDGGFIDQREQVEVTGFENFSVIVRKK